MRFIATGNNMVRPKLFLDTNVCITAASGKDIKPREWRRVQRFISENFAYCISFITFKELLIKLANGADDHFNNNKEPLRVLYRPRLRRFLPYPSVFALRTVLGISDAARIDDSELNEEVWAEQVYRAVIAAPNKERLKAGIPERLGRKMVTFDLDHFATREDSSQKEHANLLQGIRDGQITMSDPTQLAAWLLHQHGLTPYTEQCERLATALDAACRFSITTEKMAKDCGYDFFEHDDDWGDVCQLFYLCDPAMHFLTIDKDFQHRCKGSLQCSRILVYRDFLRSIP
jgi:hypothetical protein